MGLDEKIKVGEKISVLLERIEDKNGDVIVSASKARKIVGWEKIVKSYENNEPVMERLFQSVRVVLQQNIQRLAHMFLPGSQISDKPLKDISRLMNEPQKFALIKLDKVRGNMYPEEKLFLLLKKKISQKLQKSIRLVTLSKC